jgi:CDP-diacylglycerol pyrophosphatase
MWFHGLTGASIIAAFAFAIGQAQADDVLFRREALWRIVSTQCVPASRAGNFPSPCLTINNDDETGFAVLKDRVGVAQVLVIPTKQISGIESPDSRKVPAKKYWSAAWNARYFVFGYLQREIARDEVSLAVNSQHERSQDQLHIHVDCIRPEVRDLLRKHADEIGYSWGLLPFDVDGKKYNARRLDDADFARTNPIALISDELTDAASDMGAETIFVTGAKFGDGKDGFILLEDRAGRALLDYGHSEDLQDHTCGVAR